MGAPVVLRIRRANEGNSNAWAELQAHDVQTGLTEDTDYLLSVGRPNARVFVDDVELRRDGSSLFSWRPSFYAGTVVAEVVVPHEEISRYLLDVSPSPSKTGQTEFDAMVADIRDFDQTLLIGTSSATMAFGQEGCTGRYENDILLARLRAYGPSFLDSVETIGRSPHRSLSADIKVLPLSRVRRLHHTSLQDRRLAAIATGRILGSESMDSFQVNSRTSTPTFDTPANRSLFALLLRFRAAVSSVREKVQELKLGAPPDEQRFRVERRLWDLDCLAQRIRQLLFTPLFREITCGETSAAGLTQIAAQPAYSRAYRLGSRALVTALEGDNGSDQLHVPPSWGIYEMWCYLCVAQCVTTLTRVTPIEVAPKAVSAERALRFGLDEKGWLEVLFQATFPALKAPMTRIGWSLSRERRPDIVLVHYGPNGPRALVFDAKWRSWRQNVLDAMESAHIYHDALRIDGAPPAPCLLLLPGQSSVPELEQDAYTYVHGVGAISSVRVEGTGRSRISEVLKAWLTSV